jgi:hypothetical protein
MDTISHKEAVKQGLKFYFTNTPCKRGHISQRRVGSCQCVECQREDNSSLEYKAKQQQRYQENRDELIQKQTDYNNQHKEQVLQYQREYREHNTEKRLQYHKDKYVENREARLKYRKERYEENPEKYKESGRQYYIKNSDKLKQYRQAYYAANRERLLEQKKQYYVDNYEEVLVRNGARRRRQAQATPCWVDKIAVVEVYRQCYNKCKETGERWVVDHHIPLRGKKVCGLHIAENLRIIPWEDNAKKGNKFQIDDNV